VYTLTARATLQPAHRGQVVFETRRRLSWRGRGNGRLRRRAGLRGGRNAELADAHGELTREGPPYSAPTTHPSCPGPVLVARRARSCARSPPTLGGTARMALSRRCANAGSGSIAPHIFYSGADTSVHCYRHPDKASQAQEHLPEEPPAVNGAGTRRLRHGLHACRQSQNLRAWSSQPRACRSAASHS